MRAAIVATLMSLCLMSVGPGVPASPVLRGSAPWTSYPGREHQEGQERREHQERQEGQERQAGRCHGLEASSARAVPPPADRSASGSTVDGTRSAPVQAVVATQAPHARIAVPVFVHVLRSRSRGGVPRSRVLAQIAVLNSAFAGRQSPFAASSPFRFRLADVDVTVNRAWYRMDEGSIAERHAKHALHQGSSSDLNLYISKSSSGGLGWGSRPRLYAAEPRMDGVVIPRRTMPGGSGGPYSAGDTAVHESGHWLDLLHTFAGRCTKRGDKVADTPAEARPGYECPRHRDTCPAAGADPVHNFMDYSRDACMNQFTPGQVARMVHAWRALRATEGA